MSREPAATVVAHLQALGDPLFALLDGARDPSALAALSTSPCPHRSLYEGTDSTTEAIAPYGPWLVDLGGSGGADLLGQLVAQGWGQSWGVYLASPAPFDAIRRHLRHYLRVELPGGTVATFRFYDPRVLRTFLRSWTTDERDAFFGPMTALALEDEAGSPVPLVDRPSSLTQHAEGSAPRGWVAR